MSLHSFNTCILASEFSQHFPPANLHFHAISGILVFHALWQLPLQHVFRFVLAILFWFRCFYTELPNTAAVWAHTDTNTRGTQILTNTCSRFVLILLLRRVRDKERKRSAHTQAAPSSRYFCLAFAAQSQNRLAPRRTAKPLGNYSKQNKKIRENRWNNGEAKTTRRVSLVVTLTRVKSAFLFSLQVQPPRCCKTQKQKKRRKKYKKIPSNVSLLHKINTWRVCLTF